MLECSLLDPQSIMRQVSVNWTIIPAGTNKQSYKLMPKQATCRASPIYKKKTNICIDIWHKLLHNFPYIFSRVRTGRANIRYSNYHDSLSSYKPSRPKKGRWGSKENRRRRVTNHYFSNTSINDTWPINKIFKIYFMVVYCINKRTAAINKILC